MKVTRRTFRPRSGGALAPTLSRLEIGCGPREEGREVEVASREAAPPPAGVPDYRGWESVYRQKWTWDRIVKGTHIRANCIAPGHVYTPMVADMTDESRDLRRRIGPLGTEGNAWDVAWAIVFLASDEARWITGVTLPVDAGTLATVPLAVAGRIRG